MTTHELAKQLLSGPDLPVLMSVDDQYGLVSPPKAPDGTEYAVAKPREWDCLVSCEEDDDGAQPVVILHPESRR